MSLQENRGGVRKWLPLHQLCPSDRISLSWTQNRKGSPLPLRQLLGQHLHDLCQLDGHGQPTYGNSTRWKFASKPHTILAWEYIVLPLPSRVKILKFPPQQQCGYTHISRSTAMQEGSSPPPSQSKLRNGS